MAKKYIVAEYKGKETWYIEEYYEGYSIQMTQDKDEAYRFSFIEAVRIAHHYGMSAEKADSIVATLYRRVTKKPKPSI